MMANMLHYIIVFMVSNAIMISDVSSVTPLIMRIILKPHLSNSVTVLWF